MSDLAAKIAERKEARVDSSTIIKINSGEMKPDALLTGYIELPVNILEIYRNRSRAEQLTLNQILSKQLIATVEENSQKAIYIDDDNRVRLDKVLGQNFSSATELVNFIEQKLSFKIDENISILIKPALMYRLKCRHLRGTWAEFLQKTLTELLEQFTGIR